MTSGYLQVVFRMSSGQDEFRLTQRRKAVREQSDFVILSESKILRLVLVKSRKIFSFSSEVLSITRFSFSILCTISYYQDF